MRNVIPSMLVAILGCQASAAPHLATQEEVLVQAKRDSSRFCSQPSTHCTYSATAIDEGWSVLAVQVVTASDGKKSYPVGGHRAYLYSIEGKLEREIPGL